MVFNAITSEITEIKLHECKSNPLLYFLNLLGNALHPTLVTFYWDIFADFHKVTARIYFILSLMSNATSAYLLLHTNVLATTFFNDQ